MPLDAADQVQVYYTLSAASLQLVKSTYGSAGTLHNCPSCSGGSEMASLNANDLEIMKVLWEEGPLKPADIQQGLARPVKNSALRWQLGVLMKKGHVTRRKKGKAYYYRATTPPQRVFPKLIRRLADVFSGGSAVALIGQLIESEEEWSEEDILELRRIAAQKMPSQKRFKSFPSQSSGKRGYQR